MEQPKIENIRAAYEVADENGKKMLRNLYPVVFTQPADLRPVTERIKSFEDACNALGQSHIYVQMYHDIYVKSEKTGANANSDVVAYLKLRIVVAALNEGWTPDWGNKDERKWFSCFYILTQKEYDELDDEVKSRVVGRARSNSNANGGLVYLLADSVSSYSYTLSGARLAFKSQELAIYCGKQFGQLLASSHLG